MNSVTISDTTNHARPDSPSMSFESPDLCLTCGECISRCFLSQSYPEINPRKIIRKTVLGREQEIVDSEFIWACTLCARCTTDCPKDIHMDTIIRRLRGLAWSQGKAPARLCEGIEKIREIGNNTGIDGEEFRETAEWIAEECEEELQEISEKASEVPFDLEGAEILYMPNPREYTSNPTLFQAYLKFFAHVEADWTLSSKVFDITNWPYYLGDQEDAVALIRAMVDETRRLGAKILLSTECGHGFKILRKDAENWLGEKIDFEVLSIVELAHRYFKQGKLKLKQGAIDTAVTYHDPCNVGRKVGVYDEPRELLRYICSNFVEMWPNRKYSICCGGGGSVSQNSDMGKKRLEHAVLKRDQILRTGAQILTTSCQNCLTQLGDLQARYEMPVQIKSVIELVVEAMEPLDS
ncbi:MAG: (Fe-S)-binding protein [Desulfomonilaceae bacterium]|jgi:Fe-S oxidoreductase